ncbi:hypothetical protein HYS94_02125 [Candidatus Daviesbacteria bacterium]|nr:hypothetical protein [Candidatus Daviesbacteria bacterium]
MKDSVGKCIKCNKHGDLGNGLCVRCWDRSLGDALGHYYSYEKWDKKMKVKFLSVQEVSDPKDKGIL